VFARHLKLIRWIIGVALGVLAGLWIATIMVSRAPLLRDALVRTLNDHIESNLIFRRIPVRMFSVLGPLLLVLASIGIYAVVAYTIAQRTKEIGVRLALGATTTRVVAEHVGESLLVVGSGALIGWMIAFVGAMLGTSESVDPMVFGLVPALLLLVATLACWIPSRRAARVDPVVALRAE